MTGSIKKNRKTMNTLEEKSHQANITSHVNSLHPDRSTPFALASLGNWLHIKRVFGGVEPAFKKRERFITLVSALITPLRWYERIRYGHLLAQTTITQPIIFILGHWRSGTTRLSGNGPTILPGLA